MQNSSSLRGQQTIIDKSVGALDSISTSEKLNDLVREMSMICNQRYQECEEKLKLPPPATGDSVAASELNLTETTETTKRPRRRKQNGGDASPASPAGTAAAAALAGLAFDEDDSEEENSFLQASADIVTRANIRAFRMRAGDACADAKMQSNLISSSRLPRQHQYQMFSIMVRPDGDTDVYVTEAFEPLVETRKFADFFSRFVHRWRTSEEANTDSESDAQ